MKNVDKNVENFIILFRSADHENFSNPIIYINFAQLY